MPIIKKDSRAPRSVFFLTLILLTIVGVPPLAHALIAQTAPPAIVPSTNPAPIPTTRPGTTQPYIAPGAMPAMSPATTQAAPAPSDDNAGGGASIHPEPGWTLLFPGAHRFYVSSSVGNDITGNGGALRPYKSIAKALRGLKAGDDLLLKRGDVFYENFGNLRLSHNTFGAYGVGDRPAVYADVAHVSCISVLNSKNVRFVGLHLSALHRDPTKPDFKLMDGLYGIYCMNCSNVLIEDCLIEYFNDDVSIEGNSTAGFRMRRCVIRNAYSAGRAFSQGIFMNGQRGALIEECVFDTCGWNATLMDEFTRRGKPAATSQPAAGDLSPTTPAWITNVVPLSNQPFPGIPNIFNHAIYNNSASGAGPSVIRNCIFVNSASTAAQQRAGGIIDNCLFIHNGMATDAFSQGDWGQITNNVVLGSQSCPPWAGGGGLSLLSKSGIMQNNIVAHGSACEQGAALVVGMPKDHEKEVPADATALVDHNVVYDWPAQGVFVVTARPQVSVTNNVIAKTGHRLVEIFDTSDVNYIFSNNNYEQPTDATQQAQMPAMKRKAYALPDFQALTSDTGPTTPPGQTPMVDPTRTIETYTQMLNLPPTLEAFVTAACLQSHDHWDPRLTAPVINEYFREGFSLK